MILPWIPTFTRTMALIFIIRFLRTLRPAWRQSKPASLSRFWTMSPLSYVSPKKEDHVPPSRLSDPHIRRLKAVGRLVIIPNKLLTYGTRSHWILTLSLPTHPQSITAMNQKTVVRPAVRYSVKLYGESGHVWQFVDMFMRAEVLKESYGILSPQT